MAVYSDAALQKKGVDMGAIAKLVTVRRAAIAAMAVLLLGGVGWGVMSYGPSEAERAAYALACEAIRQKLPEDQRAAAVFPEVGSRQVYLSWHDAIGPEQPRLCYIQASVNGVGWNATASVSKVYKSNYPLPKEAILP